MEQTGIDPADRVDALVKSTKHAVIQAMFAVSPITHQLTVMAMSLGTIAMLLSLGSGSADFPPGLDGLVYPAGLIIGCCSYLLASSRSLFPVLLVVLAAALCLVAPWPAESAFRIWTTFGLTIAAFAGLAVFVVFGGWRPAAD